MAVACRDVQVKDIEDISICHIRVVSGIQVQLFWRDVYVIEDEVALFRGDGICPVLLNLVPVVIINYVPLQVLLILFFVEYKTLDQLANLGVTDIRQASWHH